MILAVSITYKAKRELSQEIKTAKYEIKWNKSLLESESQLLN